MLLLLHIGPLTSSSEMCDAAPNQPTSLSRFHARPNPVHTASTQKLCLIPIAKPFTPVPDSPSELPIALIVYAALLSLSIWA